MIDGLIEEMYNSQNNLFFDNYIHLGGDEANTICWTEDPVIVNWMKKNHFTPYEAYQYFLQTVNNIARSHNRITIQWDDATGLVSKNVIIEAYYFYNIHQVVSDGYHSILSNENGWYLDHLNLTWQIMYNNEPCKNIATTVCNEYVLGGEMSMWSESVDDSDMDQTIWPRSAAGAERLWSQRSQTDNNENNAHPRIEYFRCLLNVRGIGAAPTNNAIARQPPAGSSSCYHQRRRRRRRMA